MLPNLDYLVHIATHAGEILMEGYLKQHEIQHKGHIDVVTEVDRCSEEYLLGEIRRDFKEHTIIAEESGYLQGKQQGACWFIDPLDGTINYVHGLPIFSVTIAFAYQHRILLGVTVDPSRGHCFCAERGKGAYLNAERIHVSATQEIVNAMLVTGFPSDTKEFAENNLNNFSTFLMHAQAIRRLGSAALDIAYVAAGWVDGYWEIGIHPWDIAAGTLLVEEAGGLVTDVHGEADYLKKPYSLLMANPLLHAKLLNVLQQTNHTQVPAV